MVCVKCWKTHYTPIYISVETAALGDLNSKIWNRNASCVLQIEFDGLYFQVKVSDGSILLKNSKKVKVCFFAESQCTLYSPQHLLCQLTSSSVGRDCYL